MTLMFNLIIIIKIIINNLLKIDGVVSLALYFLSQLSRISLMVAIATLECLRVFFPKQTIPLPKFQLT